MKRIFPATAMLVFLLWCHSGMCGPDDTYDLVEPVGSGSINWSRLFVEAEGFGTSSQEAYNTPAGWETALRRAERDAYRGLIEAFMALRLSAHWRVGDVALKNDRVLAKIERLVQTAEVRDIVYSSEGTVEVIRRMPISGALSQLILPEYIVQLEMKNLGGRSSGNKDNDSFTGLILDARGIDIEPAMCFSVHDEGGREVYGPAYVSREFVVQHGMCSYAVDMAAVEKSSRVGPRPLTVKAIKAQPSGGPNIIISNTDASRLRSAVEHLVFLRQCRVIVVRDPFREEAGP